MKRLERMKPLALPLLLMLLVVLMFSGMGAGAAGAEEELVWKIAFASYRDGREEIYVMNADGSNQTNLTNSPGDDYSPAWASPACAETLFYIFSGPGPRPRKHFFIWQKD